MFQNRTEIWAHNVISNKCGRPSGQVKRPTNKTTANDITAENAEGLLNELSKYKRITDVKFMNSLRKYFTITWFRDKPFIEEDIWLFNYLMYQNHKPENFNPLKFGEEVHLKGRLLKKGLIVKYENKVILPQLALLREANKILKNI